MIDVADGLAMAVAELLGRSVPIRGWTATALPSSAPTTAAIHRLRGSTFDGTRWSVIGKVLQHPRHWLGLATLPPDQRADLLKGYPWRAELSAWEAGFADRLPDGLRLPVRYTVQELGNDRVAVFMEDVPVSAHGWDVATYRRAARALGGLAARRSDPAAVAAHGEPGAGLRRYVDTRLHGWFRALLDDRQVWRDPVLAPVATGLIEALRRLYNSTEDMLAALNRLPQALAHGDASPQNLLIPAATPDTFVAIDMGFQGPLAVGFDLGQLLVGLVHAGTMSAATLESVHHVLVPAYVDGFRAHGGEIETEPVARGYLLGMMIRSGFTSLPFQALGRPPTPALEALVRERSELTRFIVDHVPSLT